MLSSFFAFDALYYALLLLTSFAKNLRFIISAVFLVNTIRTLTKAGINFFIWPNRRHFFRKIISLLILGSLILTHRLGCFHFFLIFWSGFWCIYNVFKLTFSLSLSLLIHHLLLVVARWCRLIIWSYTLILEIRLLGLRHSYSIITYILLVWSC